MSELQVTWFFLVGVLLTGYAVLDGFDLGVGFWHLFTRKDRERRTLLGAIGPVWDGNEVWLLTGGGAIFAAFPPVYSTVFSGFYLALMLVLLGLILRAVAIEFRSQSPSPKWRSVWDLAFAVGSVLPALLFGVALGNIMRGLELDAQSYYAGGFFDLLNPYALLVGVTGLAMLVSHGAFFLVGKTEGELKERARSWGIRSWFVFIALFVVMSGTTFAMQPQLLDNLEKYPVLWLIPLLAFVFILFTGIAAKKGFDGRAFLFSCLSVVGVMALVGASIFPNLVPALNDPKLSLTIYNGSSSKLTLKVMLILALIGMPVVLGYTAWIYRKFAGPVKLDNDGY